jgi:hypothetical protein
MESQAWWWYPSLPVEASLLRIEVDPAELQGQLDVYTQRPSLLQRRKRQNLPLRIGEQCSLETTSDLNS